MNEYQNKYEVLISTYRQTQLPSNQYCEKHHIKPTSCFPELIKDPNNIVKLPYVKHLLAHKYIALWYLTEYGREDERTEHMLYAFEKMICIAIKYMTVEQIVEIDVNAIDTIKLRTEYIELIKRPKSKKHCKHISESLKGKVKSKEHKLALSKASKYLSETTIFVNNGKINKRVKSTNIPKGFKPGRIQKSGYVWINNGQTAIRWFSNTLPAGYVKGRLSAHIRGLKQNLT